MASVRLKFKALASRNGEDLEHECWRLQVSSCLSFRCTSLFAFIQSWTDIFLLKLSLFALSPSFSTLVPPSLPLPLLLSLLPLSLSHWKMQVSEKFVSTLLRPFEPNLSRPAAKIREKVKNFEPEMQHHHPSSSPKFKKGCPKFFFLFASPRNSGLLITLLSCRLYF